MNLYNFLLLVDKGATVQIECAGDILVDAMPLQRLPFVRVVPYMSSQVATVSVSMSGEHTLRVILASPDVRRAAVR